MVLLFLKYVKYFRVAALIKLYIMKNVNVKVNTYFLLNDIYVPGYGQGYCVAYEIMKKNTYM